MTQRPRTHGEFSQFARIFGLAENYFNLDFLSEPMLLIWHSKLWLLPFFRFRLRFRWRLTLLFPYVFREIVRPNEVTCCAPVLRCIRGLSGIRVRALTGYRMSCEATAPPDAAAIAARLIRACTPFPLFRFGTLPAHDPTTTPPTFNW